MNGVTSAHERRAPTLIIENLVFLSVCESGGTGRRTAVINRSKAAENPAHPMDAKIFRPVLEKC